MDELKGDLRATTHIPAFWQPSFFVVCQGSERVLQIYHCFLAFQWPCRQRSVMKFEYFSGTH